jgi:hypothetical protein
VRFEVQKVQKKVQLKRRKVSCCLLFMSCMSLLDDLTTERHVVLDIDGSALFCICRLVVFFVLCHFFFCASGSSSRDWLAICIAYEIFNAFVPFETQNDYKRRFWVYFRILFTYLPS